MTLLEILEHLNDHPDLIFFADAIAGAEADSDPDDPNDSWVTVIQAAIAEYKADEPNAASGKQ